MADNSRRKASTVKDVGLEGYRLMVGEHLLKAGHITRGQLEEGTKWVRGHPKDGFLATFLLKKGYIEGNTIPSVLSRQYGFPLASLTEREIPPELAAIVPFDLAKKFMAVPYNKKDTKLYMAMIEPTNNRYIEELSKQINMQVVPAVTAEDDLLDAMKRLYHISEEDYQAFKAPLDPKEVYEDTSSMTVDNLGALISDALDDFTLESGGSASEDGNVPGEVFSAENSAIINLANQILLQAVQGGVSDVHIEPFERQFYVRYRIDGSLYKHTRLPLEIKNALIARLKIMARLDITERRVPQDGRIKMRLGKNKEIDFRVSSLPTLFGESVVLRILDKSGLNVDMTKLGFTQKNLDQFMKAVYRPNGLLLVTGPTGSGKTVTLYSSLSLRNTEDVKILTAEDPVEFNFPGVNQVNIIKEVGMTFARALKAFLRQDPDICMIGEIRDLETGEIAVEAAMTGHLVLSTLHTNDSPSTITRLVDMGVAPYNVSAALVLCSAQRLLRRICPNCKQPMAKMSANKLVEAGFDRNEVASIQLYEGRGCSVCNSGGYKGRLGVFEVLELTPEVAEAISSEVPESQLRKIALKEGMATLRADGLLKAQQGLTTLDQVLEKTVLQKESMPHYLLNPDELTFENGDTIIREGNSDTNFYKLIQGCLEVYKGQNLIGEVSQVGTYFGEMSMLMGGKRSATIKSQGRSIVKVFPGDKLVEVIEGYPDIAKNMLTAMVDRLYATNLKLSDYIQNKVELERTYITHLAKGPEGAAGGRPMASLSSNVAGAARPSALTKLAAATGKGKPVITATPKTQPALNPQGARPVTIKSAASPGQSAESLTIQAAVKGGDMSNVDATVLPGQLGQPNSGGPFPAPDVTMLVTPRILVQADQTQLKIVPAQAAPAAKTLKEAQ